MTHNIYMHGRMNTKYIHIKLKELLEEAREPCTRDLWNYSHYNPILALIWRHNGSTSCLNG